MHAEAVPQAELAEIFIPGGRTITLARFAHAGQPRRWRHSSAALRGTRSGAALESKAATFAITDRLVARGGRCRRASCEEGAAWFCRDPLWIGFSIGYLWHKVGEVANLRWSARGKGSGCRAEEIEALILV